MPCSVPTRFSEHTSPDWVAYFNANCEPITETAWSLEPTLTLAERDRIARSVQIFQRGESGTGSHLMKCALTYAEQSGDEVYPQALQLFIDEENRHADALGRFLDQEEISRLEREWSDSGFRRLRKLAGLEQCVVTLLAAETIAMAYYAALMSATGSPTLAAICRRLLADEVGHLRFQAEQLGRLRQRRNPITLAAARWRDRLILRGAMLLVWRTHRPVFRAAGWDFNWFERNIFAQARVVRSHEQRQIAKLNEVSVDQVSANQVSLNQATTLNEKMPPTVDCSTSRRHFVAESISSHSSRSRPSGIRPTA
ncbi:ferritin-like domain-containing protein [Stratiformator vulcanicus]|uniref:Ferritin-like domain-containing protein n=1 Tax=Stratiformator vulcanicus TaxID=2527980 RepID=A0A517QZ12_9PLAN|nr:ferritin-like domain-containing protein [Stratiformator vulcanicus]QDT36844.1 hypothetical protein Pan189_12070 [Stratiformator vulcanicus]